MDSQRQLDACCILVTIGPAIHLSETLRALEKTDDGSSCNHNMHSLRAIKCSLWATGIALFTIAALACSGTSYAENLARHSEEEIQAVKQRREISRLHIEYRATLFLAKTDEERFFRKEFWLDGHKLREDFIRPLQKDWTASPNTFRDSIIVTPDFQAKWTSIKHGGIQDVAVSYRKVKEGAPPFGPKDILDPRLIGLVPATSSNLRHYSFETILMGADRESITVQDTEINRKASRRLTFRRSDAVDFEIVFQDFGGWQPVLIKGKEIASGIRMEYWLEVLEYAEPKPGRFFPKHLVYTCIENGKIIREEDGWLDVRSLDDAIDAEAFSVKGMDIPKGQPVMILPPENGTHIWNGEAIITNTAKNQGTPARGANCFPSGFDVLTFILAIVGMISAYVAIRRGLRPSEAGASSKVGLASDV